MAEWKGSARSNYFAVKDEEAFRDMIATRLPEIEVHNASPSNEASRQGKLSLSVGADSEDGGWPSSILDESGDEEIDDGEVTIASLIAPHLVEGEIVVMLEAGAEKLNYISASAKAFNHEGREVSLCLLDIFAMAKKEFGKEPDQASY